MSIMEVRLLVFPEPKLVQGTAFVLEPQHRHRFLENLSRCRARSSGSADRGM